MKTFITQIEAIGCVFVLLPPYLAILVLIVVLPVFVHILFNVSPLPVFDPGVKLCVAHIAILVSVNAVYNLPADRASVIVDNNKIIYLCLSFWKWSCKLNDVSRNYDKKAFYAETFDIPIFPSVRMPE